MDPLNPDLWAYCCSCCKDPFSGGPELFPVIEYVFEDGSELVNTGTLGATADLTSTGAGAEFVQVDNVDYFRGQAYTANSWAKTDNGAAEVPADQLTISARVCPSYASDGVDRNIFGQLFPTPPKAVATLYRTLTQWGATIEAGGNNQTLLGGNGPVVVGRTVNVAVTYDGATIRLYENDAEIANVAKTGNVTNALGPWVVGGGDSVGGSANAIGADLTDCEVFFEALTPAQIALLAGQRTVPDRKVSKWFEGSDSYTLNGGTNYDYGVSDSFVVLVWFRRRPGTVGYHPLIAKASTGASYRGYQCICFDNKLDFILSAGGGSFSRLRADLDINDDAWHLASFEYSGGGNLASMKIRIDGDNEPTRVAVQDTLAGGPISNPGAPFQFGEIEGDVSNLLDQTRVGHGAVKLGGVTGAQLDAIYAAGAFVPIADNFDPDGSWILTDAEEMGVIAPDAGSVSLTPGVNSTYIVEEVEGRD